MAFARTLGKARVIAAVPRFVARLQPSDPPVGAPWAATWLELPETLGAVAYRNLLTGETLAVGAREGRPGLPMEAVFALFPVALLEATDEG